MAAALGYFAGARGLIALGRANEPLASTPLARVGLALQQPGLQTSEKTWAVLRSDVEAVRATLQPEERSVFDLIVAVRGLTNSGDSDWVRAEALCKGLQWSRCDRAALEDLKRSSRP
ncbi:MAG TPA: hypothetical protein VFQ61_12380 [Polyangiaceae bacterium]|nr:hypothetical protein [Polyangiaceae bacterium]